MNTVPHLFYILYTRTIHEELNYDEAQTSYFHTFNFCPVFKLPCPGEKQNPGRQDEICRNSVNSGERIKISKI